MKQDKKPLIPNKFCENKPLENIRRSIAEALFFIKHYPKTKGVVGG